MIKSIISLLIIFLSVNCFATDFKVKKVRTIGDKRKVIYQSQNLTKVKGTNLLKGKIVAQWGLHVYEVVNGFYACKKDYTCSLSTYDRVATYKECKVKNKTKVQCLGRISGESGEPSDDVLVADDPDRIYDDMTTNLDDEGDFPVRSVDEFDGLF